MRLIVSGGGSAGHITPVLATLEVLKSDVKDLEVLWVGQSSGMEARIAQAQGIDFAAIRAGKFRRMPSSHIIKQLFNPTTLGLNARDTVRVVSGIYQSIAIIRRYKPDLIFIKGGFVGLPLGLAAGWLRVPYIIHESDLTPGIANKLLAKRAQRIATGFPTDKYPDLPAQKLVYTGNPVRSQIIGLDTKAARRHFGLSATLPVVLITGGSQGARDINQAIIKALPQLVKHYQLLHITGELDIESVQFQAQRLSLPHPERYQTHAFLGADMGQALAAADVVISRAGANTIAELALLGKPTILVPLDGHQTDNARMLARAGAVRVINEDKLNPAVIERELASIMGSKTEQDFLCQHISSFAVPDAAKRLADEIIAVAGDHAQG